MQPKLITVSMRVTPEDLARIQEHADALGWSVAQFIRRSVEVQIAKPIPRRVTLE